MYYVIKVQIKGITKPPVWRRFEVPADARLSDFHAAIQDAFGWDNGHLHSFEDRSVRWCTEYPDDDATPWAVPEPDLTVEEFIHLVPHPVYVYDFGDWWEHAIKVEEVKEGTVDDVNCIAGRGACPIEDCGGPYGYEDIKRVLASKDPKDAQSQKNTLEWLGLDSPEQFDPNACDYKPR